MAVDRGWEPSRSGDRLRSDTRRGAAPTDVDSRLVKASAVTGLLAVGVLVSAAWVAGSWAAGTAAMIVGADVVAQVALLAARRRERKAERHAGPRHPHRGRRARFYWPAVLGAAAAAAAMGWAGPAVAQVIRESAESPSEVELSMAAAGLALAVVAKALTTLPAGTRLAAGRGSFVPDVEPLSLSRRGGPGPASGAVDLSSPLKFPVAPSATTRWSAGPGGWDAEHPDHDAWELDGSDDPDPNPDLDDDLDDEPADDRFDGKSILRSGPGVGSWLLTELRRGPHPAVGMVARQDLTTCAGLSVVGALLVVGAAVQDHRYDGWAAGTAVAWLALGLLVHLVHMRSLVSGGDVAPATREAVAAVVDVEPSVRRLVHTEAHHVGPDEALVAVRVQLVEGLAPAEVVEVIDRIRRSLVHAVPGAGSVYVEPEITAEPLAPPPDGFATGGTYLLPGERTQLPEGLPTIPQNPT